MTTRVEIEEAELLRLQQQLAAAQPSREMLDLIGKNPKTRKQMLALFKEVKPDAAIPEIDAPAAALAEVDEKLRPLRDAVDALTGKLTEREKRESESATLNDIEGGRKALRTAGYTDEGITAIEDLMKKRGIADHEAAAALFDRQNPKDEPVFPSDYGTRMVMPFEADQAADEMKKIVGMTKNAALKQADRWTQSEVRRGLLELRAGR